MAAGIQIRKATVNDAGMILQFIKELAVYEKNEDQVTATVADIEQSMFGQHSIAIPLICEIDGTSAGFAVYFYHYSTWQGKKGLYLEDLYVSPEFRGRGAGKAFLTYLAGTAVKNKCARFEFSVLDWNTPAIGFYESLGASPQKEWIKYRFSGDALNRLARESQTAGPASDSRQ